ncbi:MAG: WbqC family protein [bacterium]
MRTVACHQPIYMPWPGFLYKALKADVVVLLDNIQFPLGISWVSRNRLKNHNGAFWLTVPVWKKGRGKQRIDEVAICNDREWQRRQYASITHAYKNAPYFGEHEEFLKEIFNRRWERLVDLNTAVLTYLFDALGITREIIMGSSLGIEARAEGLLIGICRRVNAGCLASLSFGRKYLDEATFRKQGIEVRLYRYTPPVYPQLWGDFLPNLSTLDLLLNCGGRKGLEILQKR